jgi:hypothetical protein
LTSYAGANDQVHPNHTRTRGLGVVVIPIDRGHAENNAAEAPFECRGTEPEAIDDIEVLDQ